MISPNFSLDDAKADFVLLVDMLKLTDLPKRLDHDLAVAFSAAIRPVVEVAGMITIALAKLKGNHDETYTKIKKFHEEATAAG